MASQIWHETKPTALLVMADGMIIEGKGVGATGVRQAEICFNTAITGYQEILTDPSYAGQIVTFTFPHIGNVGANDEDIEAMEGARGPLVAGAVFRADITHPSNYRAGVSFSDWLKRRDIIAMTGVDTRALTALIRDKGLLNGVIAHDAEGNFDRADLADRARTFAGLEGADLATAVSAADKTSWSQTPWQWPDSFGETSGDKMHVVAIDYGIKRNILRLLAAMDARVTVVPASTSADDILALEPDGIFLSNGPGDPAATGKAHAIATLQSLIESGIPIFGICLGHQLLALALGARTVKMHQGHHGANHPVKDFTTGKVEIVSMNHGFAVDADSLPAGVGETHKSLFDGSNCGLEVQDKPIFSVQYHPEASPGPRDSHYLFTRFAELIRRKSRGAKAAG